MGNHSRSYFEILSNFSCLKWIYLAAVIKLHSGSISVLADINNEGKFNGIEIYETVHSADPIILPNFEPMPKNITAVIGKPAYLTCKIKNLNSRSVSWVRHRDVHILTVDTGTYTSDQRFSTVSHKQAMNISEWTLQIKSVQPRDAGVYECQVSTQPIMTYTINLNIVRPQVTILGESDLHVDAGSTINITCAIISSSEPPNYIFWYHNIEAIGEDSPRGGIKIILVKGNITISTLLVKNAEVRDSGKYTCRPADATDVSVQVHVLKEEHPAAMQTGFAIKPSSAWNILLLSLLLVVLESMRNIWNR